MQLIKRWRDKWFHGREEPSTPSIVITRLAADAYDGEETPYECVARILNEWHVGFAKGMPVVRNPVNEKEVISEKWQNNPACFAAFRVAVAEFRDKWRALPETAGAHNLGRALDDLFGSGASAAVKALLEPHELAWETKTRHVSRDTRTLLPAAAPAAIKVKDRTFYGD